jgi:YggT family protein
MGWDVLLVFLEVYKWTLIVRVLAGWFMRGPNPLMDVLETVTDPVLRPLASVIPPMGGLDLSPIVAIFGVHLAQTMIWMAAY